MVTINFADALAKPVDFVPEDKHAFLEDIASINGGNFVAVYRRDVSVIYSKMVLPPFH